MIMTYDIITYYDIFSNNLSSIESKGPKSASRVRFMVDDGGSLNHDGGQPDGWGHDMHASARGKVRGKFQLTKPGRKYIG